MYIIIILAVCVWESSNPAAFLWSSLSAGQIIVLLETRRVCRWGEVRTVITASCCLEAPTLTEHSQASGRPIAVCCEATSVVKNFISRWRSSESGIRPRQRGKKTSLGARPPMMLQSRSALSVSASEACEMIGPVRDQGPGSQVCPAPGAQQGLSLRTHSSQWFSFHIQSGESQVTLWSRGSASWSHSFAKNQISE